MASRVKPKILILGTGRAGTSFLMQLLSACHVDTGFDRPKPEDSWLEPVRAGHELDVAHIMRTPSHHLPLILKNPKLSLNIDQLVTRMEIGHVLLPIRNLDDACKSRIKGMPYWGDVFWDGVSEKGFPNHESFLIYVIGKVVNDCVKYNIPFTTIEYPRMAIEVDYTYCKLKPVVSGISQHIFEEKFKETTILKA